MLISIIQTNINVSFGQGGNNCASAAANQLTIPFDVNTYNLCGGGNNYTGANGCNNTTSWINPYGGQDRFFAFTPTESGFLNLQFSNITASGTVYPVLYVFEGCPTAGGTCIRNLSGNTTVVGTSAIVPVSVGVTYYIVVDAITYSFINASNCYRFRLRGSLITVPVQPGCTNMGFNSNNFSGWFGTTGTATTGPANALTPNYNITATGILDGRHTIMTGGNDPCGGFPRVDPQGGPYSVRLGNNQTGAQAEQLRQTFAVSPNNSSFTYRYAVVFEDPSHSPQDQPFFRALIRDANGNIIPCSDFVVSAGVGIPGFLNSTSCATVRYKPWSTVNVDLSNYVGQNVTVEFTTGDCSHSGHFGYAYVDAACAPSTLNTLGDTICLGESATLTAPEGYANYNWMPGNINSQSITVSPTQTTNYTLSLTGFNGCVTTFQIPVVVAPSPTASFNYVVDGCDDPVAFTATGTVPSGTISASWNFGAGSTPSNSNQINASSVFSGPGTFPVTLTQTSSAGCTASVTQNITIHPCTFSARISGDTICAGACHTFNVSTNYGTAPFQYQWSNGSTTPSIYVCPTQTTTYTVTVTDALGVVSSDNAQVTIAPAIQFQPQLSHISCFGANDGSINPNPVGFGPFSPSWSNGSNAMNLNQLSSGTYTLNVTDKYGCPGSSQFTINQPQTITANLQLTSPTCGLDNGTININVTAGGTAPFNYLLNNSDYSSVPSFNNLAAGNYEIVIIDDNNCSKTLQTNLQSTSYPSHFSIAAIDATCGLANGSFQVNNVIGGIAPYSIRVNNNNIQTNINFPHQRNNLQEGNYNIRITDQNGCFVDSMISLAQHPGPESVVLDIVPASCGLNNATLNVSNVINGTNPYYYKIGSGDFSSNQNFTQLAPGNLLVSVIDNNNCLLDTLVNIPFIEDLTITAAVNNHVSCFGFNNGNAGVNILSGSAPFNAVWQNGQTGFVADSLAYGDWTVTVSDSMGCVKNAQVSIQQPDQLQANLTIHDATCDAPNGVIHVMSTNGGTSPYTYSLNNTTPTGEVVFTSLAADNYQITVTDNLDCSVQLNATVNMTSFPTQMNFSLVDATCGETNGIINITGVNGGIGPFKYSFENNAPQAIISFPISRNGFDEGLYAVRIIDLNGCELDSTVSLRQFHGPTDIFAQIQAATCDLDNGGLTLSAEGGIQPYQYRLNNSGFGVSNVFNPLAPDVYQISVRDSNNCVFTKTTEVNALENVAVNVAMVSPIVCHNFSTGILMAQTTSGYSPFQYQWSNGDNQQVAGALATGNYEVTVIDANQCEATASYFLPNPEPILLTIQAPDYVCRGLPVELQGNVTGAQGHYNINWLNGHLFGENIQFVPDSSMTIHALASDALGCQAFDTTSIEIKENPTGIVSVDEKEGCAPVCVNFDVQVTSPDSIQSYSWLSTQNEIGNSIDQKFCFTESGQQNATVTITDIYGCRKEIMGNNFVEVYALPVAQFTFDPRQTDIIEPEYQFYQQSTNVESSHWTFGDGTASTEFEPSHTYQDTGKYDVCLRVTSGYNCVDQICKKLKIEPFPTFYAPNIFTPNNDGNNDVFKLYFTYVKEFYIEIYNRWGEMIFASNDHERGWDGTYKGNRAQDDSYVWKANFKNSLNQSKTEYGRVLLTR